MGLLEIFYYYRGPEFKILFQLLKTLTFLSRKIDFNRWSGPKYIFHSDRVSGWLGLVPLAPTHIRILRLSFFLENNEVY